MNWAALLFSTALLAAGCSPESKGGRFYVNASAGNDSNNGSEASPWKTIQKAAKTVGTGATVMVSAGTYNERVQIRRSGSAGFRITFQAQGKVITQGFAIHASYVTVNGFEITNSGSNFPDSTGVFISGAQNEISNCYIHDILNHAGILVSGGTATNHNLVENNTIVRARIAGVEVEGQNNIIEGNDISHTLKDAPGSVPILGADADGIRFSGSGNIIRKNYVHDIHLTDAGNHFCFEGGSACPHIDVFQTRGPASDIIFEANVAVWTDDGLSGRLPGVNPQWAMIEAAYGATVTNLTFKNNIFMHETTRWGPMNFDDAQGGPMSNITIVNNTFVRLNGPGTGGGAFAISLTSSRGLLSNVTIENNAFYDCGNWEDSYVNVNGFKAKVGYNAVYMSSGSAPAGGPMPNDVWMVNPKFVNFAARDFHLETTSPLIDAGTNVAAVPDDLDGIARPQRLRYDIGAYEKP